MINQNRLIEIFLELIKIDSPTYKEKDLAEYLLESFLQVGINAFCDSSHLATGSNIGNVIAKVEGNIEAKPLMLNAHMDTIESSKGINPIVTANEIKTDGKTILGADCKAGVAVILEAIHSLKENEIKHGSIEILFTVAEEQGLKGARNLDFSMFESKDCFVFDAGGYAANVITSAPYQNNLTFEFIGKASHAGVEPEKGINSILAASKTINSMPMGRIDNESTANAGVIEGGKVTNIVPDYCVIKTEARSQDEGKLIKITKDILEAAEKASNEVGTEMKMQLDEVYKGYRINKNQTVFKVADLSIKEINEIPHLIASGGGSDANIFNANGLNAITLSPGNSASHSVNESVDINEFTKAAMIAVKIIEIYAGENIQCYI